MRPHPSKRVSMNNKFDLVKGEGKINALMQMVKEHMASNPNTLHSLQKTTSLQNQTSRPDLSLHDTIHSLAETLTAFMKQYRQIGHNTIDTYSNLLRSELDDDNPDRSPISTHNPKISMYLIHEDTYTLTHLIYHYSHFKYFRIFPYFPISSPIEQKNSITHGLILISSGLIGEELIRIIRTIRNHITSTPIIVMEYTRPKPSNIPGINGTVIEENPRTEILDLILAGLRTQTLNQVKDFIKYYRGDMKLRSIFTRRWCSRGYV